MVGLLRVHCCSSELRVGSVMANGGPGFMSYSQDTGLNDSHTEDRLLSFSYSCFIHIVYVMTTYQILVQKRSCNTQYFYICLCYLSAKHHSLLNLFQLTMTPGGNLFWVYVSLLMLMNRKQCYSLKLNNC